MWTREEEFTWAYFRPAGVIEIASGANHDGTLTAWECHNYNSGPAAIGVPYNVPNKLIQFHPVDAPPLRQGSYRGLAATANPLDEANIGLFTCLVQEMSDQTQFIMITHGS